MIDAAPRRGRRRALISGVAVVAACALAYGAAIASTGHSQLARAIVWLEADVDDIHRFPSRPVPASASRPLVDATDETDEAVVASFDRIDRALTGGSDLDELLERTRTTALLVLRGDALLIERYGGAVGRDTLQTSFSMAKSVLSTLVGAAIDDGSIGSLDDPVTAYLPELRDRDPRFDDITLRHLVTMSSGIQYVEHGLPWSDDATTYYAPDLRGAALGSVVAEPPGQRWHYNNYNPLLLGMVIERATGQSVASYTSSALWRPLGAGADASWSLDSEASAFEKMESGFNARPRDYALFGRLMLDDGRAGGRQVVPETWVREATAAGPAEHYGHLWWVHPDVDDEVRADFAARGNFGQYIYVAPAEGLVIVRLGRETGGVEWPALLGALADQIGSAPVAGGAD